MSKARNILKSPKFRKRLIAGGCTLAVAALAVAGGFGIVHHRESSLADRLPGHTFAVSQSSIPAQGTPKLKFVGSHKVIAELNGRHTDSRVDLSDAKMTVKHTVKVPKKVAEQAPKSSKLPKSGKLTTKSVMKRVKATRKAVTLEPSYSEAQGHVSRIPKQYAETMQMKLTQE